LFASGYLHTKDIVPILRSPVQERKNDLLFLIKFRKAACLDLKNFSTYLQPRRGAELQLAYNPLTLMTRSFRA
jgi:hypothetical protein